MIAAFSITFRKCRASNCARKIWMPLIFTFVELYVPNESIYTGQFCSFIIRFIKFLKVISFMMNLIIINNYNDFEQVKYIPGVYNVPFCFPSPPPFILTFFVAFQLFLSLLFLILVFPFSPPFTSFVKRVVRNPIHPCCILMLN